MGNGFMEKYFQELLLNNILKMGMGQTYMIIKYFVLMEKQNLWTYIVGGLELIKEIYMI